MKERFNTVTTKKDKEYLEAIGDGDMTKGFHLLINFARDEYDLFVEWYQNQQKQKLQVVRDENIG